MLLLTVQLGGGGGNGVPCCVADNPNDNHELVLSPSGSVRVALADSPRPLPSSSRRTTTTPKRTFVAERGATGS